MLSPVVWLISILTLWHASHQDARSATLALLCCGYTPDEVAAAGITASDVQNVVTALNTDAVPLRLEQAVAARSLAAQTLTDARESYLRTRSTETALAFETAKIAERVARQNVASLRGEVHESFQVTTSAGAAARVARCVAASGFGLPTHCRFIDPEVVRPDAIARAVHRIDRAARDGRGADPADFQLIQLVENHAEVRDAATNLAAYGASVRSLYDANLGE